MGAEENRPGKLWFMINSCLYLFVFAGQNTKKCIFSNKIVNNIFKVLLFNCSVKFSHYIKLS